MDPLGERLLKKGIITEAQLATALQRQGQQGGRLGHNLIDLGFIDEEELRKILRAHPALPMTVEETGLDLGFIADLVMKHVLFMGEFTLNDVAARVKLSVAIVEEAVHLLRRDKLVETRGGTGYSSLTYNFALTGQGKDRAFSLLEFCRYVGPAPVTLTTYCNLVEEQTVKSAIIDEESLKRAFSHMVISDRTLKLLGPAISSGEAIFLYGPPGNGKTSIAETVGSIFPDTVYIPYSLIVGGQIISLFDTANHCPIGDGTPEASIDQRLVHIKRPVIITGGELTLRMLDIDFNESSRYCEASLQMKANNGLFIVDDFGRQQINPQNLLNRWIVPLDRGVDFMNLHSGMKFSIPFDMLIIFSTNLEPKALVDEAFLRRIQYKVKIDHPTDEEFLAIFKLACESRGMTFDQDAFDYLVTTYYRKLGIRFNACHPRDIVDFIVTSARYYKQAAELTREGIDAAWTNYFVEM